MIFDGEDDCVEPQFTAVNEYHFEVTNDQPALMKLKIPHRFIGDVTKTTEEPRTWGTKVQFTGSDEPRARNNGIDSYSDNDDNGDDSDYDDDSNSDGDTINADDADALCALCDDGGNLLSCIGRCKRSFHPRKEDGRESKCKTLCYTSAELKEIDSYICKNCEYKQHQCFKCGELEPSAEPNAKVFECNNPTCGHFYHPKCVAKLLDPDDSDALAKRIMAGMSFTCPAHWCFQCGRMEDKTERAMQFAVCRRCPKSYHRECLPREISFGTKDNNIKPRAWKLSGIVIIYCLYHKICKATGTAERGHIKFPHTPKITKGRDLAKKKGKMVGKKKRNIGQCSKKSTKVLNRLPGEKIEDTEKSLEHMVLQPECSAMNLKEDLQIEPSMVGAACLSGQKALKGQKKQFGSSLSSSAVGSKTKKRKTSGPKKERSSRTSCNIAEKCVDHSVQIADKLHSHMQPSNTENLMDNAPVDKDAELDNEICRIPEDKDGHGKDKSSENLVEAEEDGTSKDTSHENNDQNDVLGKIAELDFETCRIPEDKDSNGKEKSSEHSGEAKEDGTNKDTSHENNERNDVLGKDAELDKEICRILEYKDGNRKEKSSEHSVEAEEDGTNKDSSHENNEQNDVLGKIFVDIHTEMDQSKFKSRAERSMESGENADGHDSISGQEISMGENQMCRSMCEQESRSGKGKIASNESAKSGSGNSVVTPDHVDDYPPEKLLHVPHVNKMTITDRLHTQPEYGCVKSLEVNGAHAFQKEPNTYQCNVNPKEMGVHTSGDNSRKRRKLNKKATDVKNTDLDKNKRCNPIEDGKEAHCDQCPSNHEGLDYQDCKSGNGVPSGPQCNDQNGAAEVSGYKSRHSTGPGSREILTHSRRENLSSSAICRNSQEKPRNHSPNRQRTYPDVYGQHPAANQHRYVYEQHPATKSKKIRKLKSNATDGNNTDLDKKKRRNHIEHGKEAHCDSGHQCPSNHEELYCQDHKFGNSVPSGSQCNDENGAAEVSEYKSRQSTGPSRREILNHSTRENSSNSPMGRNSQGKPRSRSPNRHRTYRDMYEQHPATNKHRYEQRHDVSYPSNGNYGPRSHVPLPPVFVPTDFDADRGYDSRSNLRGPEHDNTGWHSPSFHPRSHEYFTSGWQSPPYCSARPDNVEYSRNVNNLPIHGYDDYDNFMHDEYRAVGFDDAAMHSPLQASYNVSYQPRPDVNMEGHGAAYGGRNREYGARSHYTFSSRPRRPAAVSVTDRYAPHLEQTNNRPRG